MSARSPTPTVHEAARLPPQPLAKLRSQRLEPVQNEPEAGATPRVRRKGPSERQTVAPSEPRNELRNEVRSNDRLRPSVWFESGLGYRPGPEGLVPHLRVGLRGLQPLTDTAALYAAFALDGDLTLDLGGWYTFSAGADDLFGFRSYAGTGLSYAAGSFGVALSAALSYELSTETSLVLVYTHRPLFFPELGQAFDVSLGISFTPAVFDPPVFDSPAPGGSPPTFQD